MSNVNIPTPPTGKKKYINDIAVNLALSYSRKPFYTVKAVEKAVATAGFQSVSLVWAISVFCTQQDYSAFCNANDIDAPYDETRTQMLSFLGNGPELATSGASYLDMLAGTGELVEAAADVWDLFSAVGDVFSAVGDVLGGIGN